MSIVGESVAGAALSAFFKVLFEKLSSTDLLKIFRQENVDADLKKWKTILLEISEVLDDAEEKQITKESVKTWMAELEDLAYDADDILDEFATEALRRRLNAEEPSGSKVRKFIPACCVGFDPSSIKFDVNMPSKIEGINTRLQKVLTDKKDLELIKITEGRRTRTSRPRPHTTSLVNKSHTYGRDEDKKAIVKLLLESGDAQLSVIPIVGMGGLGKTTLAQLVYDEVSRHFELKAWVCVSEDFDNLRLTKEILRSFTSESCHDNNNLDSLQCKLKDTLSGKKFLLILDDVWNENYELWTELCKPFEFGALGSKIVVTTRNDDVSLKMGTTPAYKLKELSRDACLCIFTHHALGKPDFSEYTKLEEFGQKIVDRCKGAPLAAIALGGLLRTTHDPYEWKNVLNSKIWDIPEDKSSIFPCLKLSYNYLPSHLKRCFAYCSLFPKDDEFEMKDLVLLWMAEGLVKKTIGEKSMEDLGGDYFRDLLKRSFFQQSSNNESLFVMHDLMNDLAKWAAGDLYYRLEDQLDGSKQYEISTKGTLRISHLENMLDANDARKVDLKGKKNLDTLVMKWNDGLQDAGIAADILDVLRPHGTMKTLSIEGYVGAKFSTWLGDPSFSNMVDLRIERCGKCMFLPAFGQLPFLKHLVIKRMDGVLSVGPEFYGEHCKQPFRSLVKLCFEDMDKWQDWIPCRVGFEEFPCLHELSISNCCKLEGKLPHHLLSLEVLSIDACEQLVVSIPSHSVLQVLKIVECKEVVHGSVKVEKLIIKNCEKLTSLSEDGLMSFVTLEIEIESCQSLVNIKLKSTLRTLTIKGCNALESLQSVIYEGGASSTSSLLMNEENLSCIGNNNASLLEHLEISNCRSLKCVSTIVDLATMLKRLDIEECPNLTLLSLRDTLPTTLKVLRLDNCPKLESIVDKLNKYTILEYIFIYRCEKLRCFPRGLHELCHLKEIHVYECNSLISLGDLLPTNLRGLGIEDCEKLEALPNNIRNLNFLQDLLIRDCPSIVSFPEEGFPTNLRQLWLSGANLCKQVLDLGLHRLTSLTYLSIANGIMDSFPEEEDGKTMLMLPSSLTTLSFEKFSNLLFLSWKFFQNLSTLEQIFIGACPKLASLSEKCFPPSLQQFRIYECPMLKQNCEKDKGIMWSKIAKIPSVVIDLVEQQK